MAGKQTVNAAVVCHKGCVRSNNEDNFFFNGSYMSLHAINAGTVMTHSFSDRNQLYGVFDGMGGGDWGERASTLAAQNMQNLYLNMGAGDTQKLLNDFALNTNKRIVEDGRSHQVDTQGTTMAVVLLRGLECHVCNVGDSRVYLMHKHKLQQMTEDHSVVAEMVRQGRLTAEQARKSPKNNVITQFLGMTEDERPAQLTCYKKVELQPGDRLMLCSDGLCDLISAAKLEEHMATTKHANDCAQQLVLTALELGGKDNTTCIVLDMGDFTPRLPVPQDRKNMYPGVVKTAMPAKASAKAAADDTDVVVKAAAAPAVSAAKKANEDTSIL